MEFLSVELSERDGENLEEPGTPYSKPPKPLDSSALQYGHLAAGQNNRPSSNTN